MNKRIIFVVLLAALVGATFTGCYGSGRKIRMAASTELLPYGYIEEDTLKGIDIDIAAYIAEETDAKLTAVCMTREEAVEAVRSGDYDIAIAAVSSGTEFGEGVSISAPYSSTSQVIMTPEGSDIKTVYGLVGKRVGYISNSTAAAYVPNINGAEGFGYEKGSDAVRELLSGKLDAVVLEKTLADVYMSENEGVVLIEKPLVSDEFVIVVSSDETELYAEITELLKSMTDDGTLGRIESRYVVAE